jgi:Zn-dependent M28 family amino/carboxypeptidase
MMKQAIKPIDISEIAVRSHRIVEILTDKYPSRSGTLPIRLNAASDFIEKDMQALGFTVESQVYLCNSSMVRNLIAEQPGKDLLKPNIILGAHYDTVQNTPGADDNASGVAGLLEIARLLKNYSNTRTIKYVAFTHEEPPFFYTSHMGSRQYARKVKHSQSKVLLMFSLEMIGYAGEHHIQKYPFPLMRQIMGYPKSGNFIALVGNLHSMNIVRLVKRAMHSECSIGVESLCAPGFIPPLFLSDHSSFWRHGYHAVMVTDTAFLRNPHYHLPSDTLSTINFQFLAEVVAGVCNAVIALDRLE